MLVQIQLLRMLCGVMVSIKNYLYSPFACKSRKIIVIYFFSLKKGLGSIPSRAIMLKFFLVMMLTLAPVPKFKPVDNDYLISYAEKGYIVRLMLYDVEHKNGSYEVLFGDEGVGSMSISTFTHYYTSFEVFELTDVLKSGKIKRDDKIHIKSNDTWYYRSYVIEVLDYYEPNTCRVIWQKEYNND